MSLASRLSSAEQAVAAAQAELERLRDEAASARRGSATVARLDGATATSAAILDHLRRDGVLRPAASLGLERLGQLARLVNRRLLKAREARRRALVLEQPRALRLGGGLALLPSSTTAISLGAALVARHLPRSGAAPAAGDRRRRHQAA